MIVAVQWLKMWAWRAASVGDCSEGKEGGAPNGCDQSLALSLRYFRERAGSLW